MTDTVDKSIDEQLEDILFKAAGGISNMAEDELKAIKNVILESLIGEDEVSRARDDKLRQSPPWQRNQLRKELRERLR